MALPSFTHWHVPICILGKCHYRPSSSPGTPSVWKWCTGHAPLKFLFVILKARLLFQRSTLQPLRKALPSLTHPSSLTLNKESGGDTPLLAQATRSGAMIWASNWGTCMQQTQLFINSSLGSFSFFFCGFRNRLVP